jgi:multiple sugar transport system permease protein
MSDDAMTVMSDNPTTAAMVTGDPTRRRETRAAGRKGRTQSNVGAHIILLVGGIVMVSPLIYQVIMSLSTNQQVQSAPPTFWPGVFQWHNYVDVFSQMPFGQELWITIAITLVRLVGQLLLCSLAGYAFARMHFTAKGVILGVILSIIMVPAQIYLIPQYQIVQGLGWLNTIIGIAAPGVFSAFGTFLMRQFFLGLPQELEDAARIDGASSFRIFWNIMLPLASNGLWALGIITVLWSWNDLMWPLIVTSSSNSSPLSVGLASLQGVHSNNYPVLMAASLMAMAPILVLFIILQKRVVAGVGRSGLK